ncbi:MAG: UvrD-helicase domain-containing protein [Candidatus Omnitrophica bacterium]|nr:UvrD-helicase domain-containing protein [Candidatus Omnitrophota bacterium]
MEASAGSGKTYCLARRYVQLLLNPRLTADQILLRNILAITFTNKAAYAMKGRILEFLKKIALGMMTSREVDEILTPIDLSLNEAGPAAVRIMDELIHRYHFFQVQTIDSFINTLLSGCAFKIGLSAAFKIKRNYNEYLAHSFDRLIDQAPGHQPLADVLDRFLYQYLFLENKSGWFPKKDMLALLSALYNQSNIYGRDFAPLRLQGDELFVRKRKILELLRELQTSLPDGTHKRFIDSLKNFLKDYQDGFDFDRVSEYFSWENVPVTKGVNVPVALDRLWAKIQSQLCQLAQAEAYCLFDPYVEVFAYINRDFHRQAAEDDVLFLPELNRRARALFDEGMVSVEELYYRLATRFTHYLLDEFQDTSRLQWQNLELMIEEALSTGGTFFYVGDKKQAIYGFRGGEVKLFDEVKDRFRAFNVRTEALTTNYRSEKAIVDFNNQVFSSENLQRFIGELRQDKTQTVDLSLNDIEQIEKIFHASTQKTGPGHQGGYVRIEYIQPVGKQQVQNETRLRLLALIKQLKERFAYSQIAILTRSNTEIEEVTSWLMAEGIFVESERTLNIKENPLIMELIALLRFLDSPIDNLSFAGFLSGDLFHRISGLTKEEMHAFLFAQRPRIDDKKDFYLYRAFRDRYEMLWNHLFADFFKNVGLYPLYELSASVLRRFQVYDNFPDEQGFFLRFLELVKEKEEEFSDLNSFLEHFESFENDELFVNVVNSDAIKILTTHKAKGLEFPVVIIPFLGMKVHAASGGGLGQQSYIVDPSEESLKLLRIKKKYLSFSEKLVEIERIQKVQSFISELNNIYVALTRAGKELYAFIPAKIGSSRNLINALIPPEWLEVGRAQGPAASEKQQKNESRLGLPVAGQQDWIGFLKEEFVDSTAVFRRREIRRGVVLHDLLSRIGAMKKTDQDRLINEVIRATQAQYPQISDWQEFVMDLKRILDAEVLQSFFVVTDGQVFLEKDVVNGLGQTRRIDRLIIKQDELWIVDYKSSREGRAKFLEQVKEYMMIIGDIEPGKTVRGFLLYLDEASFEEVI